MFEKIEFLVGYLKSMPIEKRYNSMGLENFSQTIEYYAGKKMLDADILGKRASAENPVWAAVYACQIWSY